MTMMFDGVQFFAFSLDVVRPECSVSVDPVLKATLIGVLPMATAAMIVALSATFAIWKSYLLRQSVLKKVPNSRGEILTMWIFQHAFFDAFFLGPSPWGIL